MKWHSYTHLCPIAGTYSHGLLCNASGIEPHPIRRMAALASVTAKVSLSAACHQSPHSALLFWSRWLSHHEMSVAPAGAGVLSLDARNCMMGSISSRPCGIVSPVLLYFESLTFSKLCFNFSSALDVTHRLSVPAQTMIGVLLLGSDEGGASAGKDPPILMTPPNSLLYETAVVSAAMPPCPRPRKTTSRGL